MRNKNTYSSIFVVSFIFISNLLFSQNIDNVYDVFTNDTLKISYNYIDISHSENSKYSNDRISISDFSIVNANTPALKTINKNLKDLCLNYLHNETQLLQLNQEYERRLKVMNEISYNRKNKPVDYRSCPSDFFKLKDINSKATSIVSGKLFITVHFIFDNIFDDYEFEYEIVIAHYYVADLSNGEINRWENKLSKSQLSYIQSKTSKKLNNQYANSDSGKLIKVENGVKEDICLQINFSEADIVWCAWGITLNFQEFTNSSKIYNGKAFSVFFALEESKEIFSVIPGFSFLNKLSMPETNFRDYNIDEMETDLLIFTKNPKIIDIFKINSIEKIPEKLVVVNQRTAKTNKVYNSSKTEYTFNKDGKVLSEKYYLDSNLVSTETYVYNNVGNILYSTRGSKNDKRSFETYTYNKQGNLIEIKKGNRRVSYEYFFYNGSYLYEFYDYNNRFISVYQTFYGKNIIFEGGSCLLNDNGDIIGINSSYIGDQEQIGRDSLGRIVELHSKRDRNNHYWNYDSLGRIVTYRKVYNNEHAENRFFYKDSSKLPYKRLYYDNLSNQYYMEDTYYWGEAK